MIFNIFYSILLAYLNPFGKPQAMILENDENADNVQLMERSQTKGQDKKKGMVLSFELDSITFDNILYSVDMPREIREQGSTEDKLVLLKGVSEVFRPGVLTALIGVSRASKTTLLDVLSKRKTRGYIDDDIKISGYGKKKETSAHISGYYKKQEKGRFLQIRSPGKRELMTSRMEMDRNNSDSSPGEHRSPHETNRKRL